MPEKKGATGAKILIVEDEKPLAHALELKLTHEGYAVTVTYGGEDGLKEALKGGHDLMLLDLIMPKVDGFTVLQTLQEKKAHVPTIVLSNLGQQEDRERAKALGAIGYYIKANTPIADIVQYVKEAVK